MINLDTPLLYSSILKILLYFLNLYALRILFLFVNNFTLLNESNWYKYKFYSGNWIQRTS